MGVGLLQTLEILVLDVLQNGIGGVVVDVEGAAADAAGIGDGLDLHIVDIGGFQSLQDLLLNPFFCVFQGVHILSGEKTCRR